MSENKFTIVGLGEVLWDNLPNGKMIGGAPANFAYVSSQLGNQGVVASRVGMDDHGREIIEKLNAGGVDVSHIQIDKKNPTGVVNVALKNGQAIYKIVENVAWDFLTLDENWQNLAENCDAVCFGSHGAEK